MAHQLGGASPRWMYTDSRLSRANTPTFPSAPSHSAWSRAPYGLLRYLKERSNLLPFIGSGPAQPHRPRQSANSSNNLCPALMHTRAQHNISSPLGLWHFSANCLLYLGGSGLARTDELRISNNNIWGDAPAIVMLHC